MTSAYLKAIFVMGVAFATTAAFADSALDVLGKDYTFPNQIKGLPGRLSDFKGLQINSFTTNDGVTLRYWEAGQGQPIIFVPGWSANGAEYINVMYLLSRHYRVIVLDQRNQGLSPNVAYGNRIARFSMDLKELTEHLHIESADYCGWSMGASVLWSYIDLFGSKGIRKAVFVDEPISIVSHADWTARQKTEEGAAFSSPDQLMTALSQPVPEHPDPSDLSLMARFKMRDSPYFANSEGFAEAVVHSDPASMMQVMYNHASSDWRDVLQYKVNVPVAIFTGEYSPNATAQKTVHALVPGSELHVYSKTEQGDHFLMFKNPVKFTQDLSAFLAK